MGDGLEDYREKPDWGPYPIGRPPTKLSDIPLLRTDGIPANYLRVPAAVYEAAPAKIVNIFERLGRAGYIAKVGAGYDIRFDALYPEQRRDLQYWWDTERERHRQLGVAHMAPPAPKPAATPQPRMSSNPPPPTIEA